MNETIPHVMRDVMTGEATTIQLKPREGMTVAEAEAFLAERKAAGLLIDPANCTVIQYYAEALDIYGIFEDPGEWSCTGSELFARNPESTGPDRYWVWLGDLPEETCEAVLKRLYGKAAP
jgi:hypothetical protein